jgi:lipopolysaccharide transport system ATP-binding protein
MSDEIAVAVHNVSKRYLLYERPQDRLKQSLFWRFGKSYAREFWALRDVSFEVKPGEALGIIGRNGAGKSTLLQIVAGTLQPTSGDVQVNGRVAALLELGSGFNLEFTGRENVYLNGAILGFSRLEIDARFDEIAAFADIGDFLDQPVKLYSSGMFVRLAFAVQACVEPDVLVIDEALSVGDVFFQQKCHARLEELLACGTALLFVSHDMGTIEKYCPKALLLHEGQPVLYGTSHEVVAHYYYLGRYDSLKTSPGSDKHVVAASNGGHTSSIEDWPSVVHQLDLSHAVVVGEIDAAKCTSVAICDANGQPCHTFEIGETATFYYEFEILKDLLVPVGGVTIITSKNIPIHAKNSMQHRIEAPAAVFRGSKVRFRQEVKLDLMTGQYIFNVGLGTTSAYYYSRTGLVSDSEIDENYVRVIGISNAGSFDIVPRRAGQPYPFYGYVGLEGSCSLEICEPD